MLEDAFGMPKNDQKLPLTKSDKWRFVEVGRCQWFCGPHFLPCFGHMPLYSYQKSIESGQLDHHSASFCVLNPKNMLPTSIYKKSKKSIFMTPPIQKLSTKFQENWLSQIPSACRFAYSSKTNFQKKIKFRFCFKSRQQRIETVE